MDFADRLVAVVDALKFAGIDFAIGGALALCYHAEPRATNDIDLNIAVPVDEAQRVFDALSQFDIEFPPAAEVPRGALGAGLRVWWDATPIDLFFPTTDFHTAVNGRAELHGFRAGGVTHQLPFLSASDLTVFKAFFDRPKDWVDIAAMAEAGSTIDMDIVEEGLLAILGDRGWPRAARVGQLLRHVR